MRKTLKFFLHLPSIKDPPYERDPKIFFKYHTSPSLQTPMRETGTFFEVSHHFQSEIPPYPESKSHTPHNPIGYPHESTKFFFIFWPNTVFPSETLPLMNFSESHTLRHRKASRENDTMVWDSQTFQELVSNGLSETLREKHPKFFMSHTSPSIRDPHATRDPEIFPSTTLSHHRRSAQFNSVTLIVGTVR
jgi:hypothetical protein